MQCKSGCAQAAKTKRDGQMPVSRGMAWKNQPLVEVVFFFSTALMT